VTPGRARALVVADSESLAARIEAALRTPGSRGVVVGAPRALARLIEEHDPLLVVLASSAPRAAAALAAIAAALPSPPIVLLVDDPRAAWTASARRAGGRSVIRRDAPDDEIRAAASAVTAGLIALDREVFRAGARLAAEESGEDRALTAREREILEAMAEGWSNRAIARRLGISAYTVKFHVAAILDKLGARTRTEAVTLGVRRGLISL
jgi:two-component system, NarL family, response regulator YdfI